MNIETSFRIEKQAMSKTIKDYSTDYYIMNYADKLLEFKYPEEAEYLKTVLDKLANWYSEEINRIKNGEYIHSKESHYKTYELIKYYLNEMTF